MNRYKEETIQYYNDNAFAFVEGTINANMSEIYANFEKYVNPRAKILDLGCGSGRDARYFMQNGYSVVAIDGSEALCDYASKELGKMVRCIDFAELDYVRAFDAIWACASLLHLNEEDLRTVVCRIYNSLKPEGILYASFKYGDGACLRGKRFFLDSNESKLNEFFNEEIGFEILETFITADVRNGRENEKWINAIMRKIPIDDTDHDILKGIRMREVIK